MATRTRSAATKQGFSVKTFSGLSKKRMASKGAGGNFGLRVNLGNSGEPVPVQFLTPVDEFIEYDNHAFQEDRKWNYVPCVGEGCPLCADEDTQRSKKTYRFIAVVYNLKEKKVQMLEGPKDMASRIYYRFERRPQLFLKRTFEVTKLATQPVSYDVSAGDDPVVSTAKLKLLDVNEYLDGEVKRFYGNEVPDVAGLDAKDDIDEDADDLEDEDATEDNYTTAQLRKKDLEDLVEIIEDELEMDVPRRIAKKKSALIDFILENQDDGSEDDDDEDEDDDDLEDEDLDDEDDDEDEDDEDDDEDDEDEDEPPARSRSRRPVKKAAPAKKAPPRKSVRRR